MLHVVVGQPKTQDLGPHDWVPFGSSFGSGPPKFGSIIGRSFGSSIGSADWGLSFGSTLIEHLSMVTPSQHHVNVAGELGMASAH